jgi:adenylyltransferase/sulfurtransferase
MAVPAIFAEDLKQRLEAGDRLYLLDVRDEDEFEISNIGGHLIPLSELPKRFHELDNQTEIIAVCKMGTRSAKAVEMLQRAGFSKVRHLAGGIFAWSDRVDHSVRKY